MIARMIAGALVGAGLLAAAPAMAEADDAVPAYARTASEIALAIHAGEDLAAREDMFVLHPAEYAELARLAGCDGAVRPSGVERTVLIEWTCGVGSDAAGLERSTLMMFAENGRLVRFGINAPLDALAPAAVSHEPAEREFPRRTASRLADAIMSGGDPSLGGIVPLTALDRERLAGFAGGKAWVHDSRVRPTVPGVADVKRIRLGDGIRSHEREVYLYFDADDRPLGLGFAPTQDPDWKPGGFKEHLQPFDTFGPIFLTRSDQNADRAAARLSPLRD